MRVVLFTSVCCLMLLFIFFPFLFWVQRLKLMGSMPPLPEKYTEAPDNEEVDSESELPPVQSPTVDAPEASEGRTRKRSRNESSDASTPPTPRGLTFLERHGEDDGA